MFVIMGFRNAVDFCCGQARLCWLAGDYSSESGVVCCLSERDGAGGERDESYDRVIFRIVPVSEYL